MRITTQFCKEATQTKFTRPVTGNLLELKLVTFCPILNLQGCKNDNIFLISGYIDMIELGRIGDDKQKYTELIHSSRYMIYMYRTINDKYMIISEYDNNGIFEFEIKNTQFIDETINSIKSNVYKLPLEYYIYRLIAKELTEQNDVLNKVSYPINKIINDSNENNLLC
jgi:hypothetical protein